MKKIIFIVFINLFSSNIFAQNADIIKWSEMEKILEDSTDRLHIINFWATWCKPCVKELSFFEDLQQQNTHLKVILVSLDFVKDYKNRLLPFLEKNQIKSKVVLLDEQDYNAWIDKIEPTWQGEIPFTLIFNHRQKVRQVIKGELSSEQLYQIIEALKN